MNILFYYGRAILPHDGGIASISLSLIEGLQNAGHTISALGKQDLGKGVFLERQFFLPSKDTLSKENIDFVCQLLRRLSIDVVINQQPIDDVAEELWIQVKKQTGIRIISCMHNPVTLSAKNFALTKEFELENKGRRLIGKFLGFAIVRYMLLKLYIFRNRKRYQKIVDFSDNVIVLCDGMRDELIEMIGREDNKIIIILNFLKSIPVFVPYSEKENIIVWCGQINFTVKRLDIMLQLWKDIQVIYLDWNLYVLGDGPDLERAKQMAANLGLERISFEGRVNPADYYCKAKFVAITSSYESFSLVTLEAMAYSALPLGFRTFPAAQFLLGDAYGELFVQAYNRDKLLECMKSLADEDSYKGLQAYLYQRAQVFAIGTILNKWITLLNNK